MKKYLPSKKFIYIVLSILITLGIVFLFSWLKDLKKDQPNEIAVAEKTINSAQKEFLVLDTDGDGLKDWEEVLWKTNPKNTDTDGDGTADFEEIKITRDPLKPNTAKAGLEPNDKVSEEVIREDKKMVEDFQKLSDTEKVSRMLFSQFLALKKLDKDLTQEEIEYIVESSLANSSKLIFKQYEIKDLNLINKNDNLQIENYTKNILSIFQNQGQVEKIDPYMIFESINENDTNEMVIKKFQALEKLIIPFEKIIKELLALETPNSLMIKHLNLINAFTKVSDNLRQIINSVDDPIKMLNLINYYTKNMMDLEYIANNFSI